MPDRLGFVGKIHEMKYMVENIVWHLPRGTIYQFLTRMDGEAIYDVIWLGTKNSIRFDGTTANYFLTYLANNDMRLTGTTICKAGE